MSHLLSAADFIRRNLAKAFPDGSVEMAAPAPAPAPKLSAADPNRVHCRECDAILTLAGNHLRCRLCRAIVCDRAACLDAHAAGHVVASVAPSQPTLPDSDPVTPYVDPPLPAGALFRCAVCRRALANGGYRKCALCDGHICRKGSQCLRDHFIAHRVAALRAAAAPPPTPPPTAPDIWD